MPSTLASLCFSSYLLEYCFKRPFLYDFSFFFLFLDMVISWIYMGADLGKLILSLL